VKRRRVFRGFLAMGYGKGVAASVQLAMVPALAASWGLPLYGQWLMLSAVPVFLAAGDFGFGSAAGNRLIGEIGRGDESAARVTFQSALVAVLACSAIVLVLSLAVAELLPDRLLAVSGGMDAGAARAVLLVFCTFGLVAMQAQLFMAVMRAHGAFTLSTSFEATVQLAEGLTVIGIVIAGGTPLEAAFGYLLVRSVGVVGHVTLAVRRAKWLRLGFGNATRSRISDLLRPSLAAMIMTVSQAGYLQGTVIAVGAAAGAAAVPIFASLRTLSRVGLQFLNALTFPILPEFTAEHARDNLPWLKRVLGATTTVNALVGSIAGLVLVLSGNALLAWWTKGAIMAPQAMIEITALALVAAAVWNPMSLFLLAVNRHEKFTYALGGAVLLSVALTYAFARHWGVTGAAAANLLLDLSMLCFAFLQLRSVVGAFPLGPSAVWALVPQQWSSNVRGRISHGFTKWRARKGE
jgi:O-antigen/teichoic acid export membrane protein